MEILSWNILSGGFKDYSSPDAHPERIEGIAEAIRNIKPDVVSLVDTHRWTEIYTAAELQQIFGYPFALAVKLEDERLIAKGHDNGITVLSRVANTRAQSIRIATRNAIKITTPEVDVFSVYLDDLSEDTRLAQIRAVLGMVDPNRPTIITGDLNTIDSDDLAEANARMEELASKFPGPMKAMETSLNEMKRGEVTRVLAENNFVDLGKGKGNTVPAKLFPLPVEGPMTRLDYAFGNRLVELENFRVITNETIGVLSDHYPIWMSVRTK